MSSQSQPTLQNPTPLCTKPRPCILKTPRFEATLRAFELSLEGVKISAIISNPRACSVLSLRSWGLGLRVEVSGFKGLGFTD